MPSSARNTLRFLALLLLHLVVAVIGTAALDTVLRRAIPIPPHTRTAVLWKEVALSVICAFLIGFGVWQRWRSEPAKWTWVIPCLWFAFGLLAVAGHGIWGPLSVSSANIGAPEMRSFSAFTVPLIRAASYSAGAYVSSRVYPRVATPADQ
jgi:uncharacterized membrane protein